MILIGQLDSPFVRRVAIALHALGIAFEQKQLSTFNNFDDVLSLNPLGKVPALELDDGTVLADSTLILDYIEQVVSKDSSLWPADPSQRGRALAHVGVALGLAEKSVEFRTETVRRAPENVEAAAVERIRTQVAAALDWLEKHTPQEGFLFEERLTHADIMSVVAVGHIANRNSELLAAQINLSERGFDRLLSHRARCEQLKEFIAAPFPVD